VYPDDCGTSTQHYHLGKMHISGILYNICCDSLQYRETERSPLRIWSIQCVQREQDIHPRKVTEFHVPILREEEQNEIIHSICVNAKCEIEKRVRLLDELPRDILSTQSLPLILGYVRNECQTSGCIPDDIGKLIAYFF